MSDDFRVTGADDFLRLSKALKNAGRTELRKKLNQGLKQGVKPLTRQAQANLATAVPARLQSRAGKTMQVVQVRTGNNAGVRVVVPYKKRGAGLGASNARMLNRRGQIRRPVFADSTKTRKEWTWVNQPVPSALGWFDKTYSGGATEVRPALERAMQDVVDEIVREAN